jgi:hypothetical protein
MTKEYIIKGIPEDLWKLCKKKAIDDNKSMKQVLIEALEAYIKKVEE